jgi:DNA primase small subunit
MSIFTCHSHILLPTATTTTTTAARCLEPALKDDFGFQHVNYIYSGRRGVHAWVSDNNARSLSNDARSAVVEYLGIDLGESEKAKKAITWPPHPMV